MLVKAATFDIMCIFLLLYINNFVLSPHYRSIFSTMRLINNMITLKDLIKIPSMQVLTLVAGGAGLDRQVKWIYMAENFNEFVQPVDWLCGNEIVFIIGKNIAKSPKNLIQLLINLNDANAAGAIIVLGPFINHIEEDIKSLCNALEFPLFTIPWEVKVVEISLTLAQLIISNSIERDIQERLLNELQSGALSKIENTLKEIGRIYGIQLFPGGCIGVIVPNTVYPDFRSDKSQVSNLVRSLAKIIKDCYIKGSLPAVVIPDEDKVLLLLPAHSHSIQANSLIFREANIQFGKMFDGSDFSVGIGSSITKANQILASYREAIDSCIVALSNNNQLMYYHDIGIYKLILSLLNTSEICVSFCEEFLNPLITYDEQNHCNLLATLRIHLSGCTADDAANSLYIHKNTLNYRLRKIEQILCCSLNNHDDLMKISLSLKIHQIAKYYHFLKAQ